MRAKSVTCTVPQQRDCETCSSVSPEWKTAASDMLVGEKLGNVNCFI